MPQRSGGNRYPFASWAKRRLRIRRKALVSMRSVHSRDGYQRPSAHDGSGFSISDGNPLNLIERYLVARAVVELRRLRRLVGRDLLGLFDGPPGFEIGRDAGGPKRVATNS